MKNIKSLLVSIIVILLLLNASVVLADPPVGTAPTIDGTIGADWADSGTMYPGGTWLLADATDDSLWGTNNEVYNVYINWDANNLYMGFDFSLNSNAFLAYVDFGDAAGITNFLSTAGYNGAWPRYIDFPSTNGIDFFYGAWDNQTGNIYVANGSNNSTDITGNCGLAKANQGGNRYHAELSCPWNELGFSAPLYPTGGSDAIPDINVFTSVMGGDNYGGCDTSPDVTIDTSDNNHISVGVSDFKNLGIGPNAITLTSFTAASALPAAIPWLAGIALALGGALAWRRKRR